MTLGSVDETTIALTKGDAPRRPGVQHARTIPLTVAFPGIFANPGRVLLLDTRPPATSQDAPGSMLDGSLLPSFLSASPHS